MNVGCDILIPHAHFLGSLMVSSCPAKFLKMGSVGKGGQAVIASSWMSSDEGSPRNELALAKQHPRTLDLGYLLI